MAPTFKVRRSDDRGHADHGWLNTYHTFSFADYYDPEFNSFGSLRVLNEDRVTPSRGFGTHSHREYEIFSYVVDGELEHKDSKGHHEVITRGQVQFTTAGTGIAHSEHNASKTRPVHFLQIWNKPFNPSLPPGYATGTFPDSSKKNRWCTIIAPWDRSDLVPATDGASPPIAIHSDFWMSAAMVEAGTEVVYTTPKVLEAPLSTPRKLFLHLVQNNPKARVVVSSDGTATSSVELKQGDGVFVTGFEGDKAGLKVRNDGEGVGEVVLMDLA